MTKVLHYLNQFFAGIGGEEKAGQEFFFLPKPIGPGVLLCDLLKNYDIEYASVVCGDNYFHEHEEAVLASLTEAMTQFAPDLFVAGAAFESEIPRIEVAPHPVPAPIQDLAHATLAMVTEGGLVPLGNPDRLESSRGTKYFKYSIKERDDLKPGEFEAMHTGYDTSTVN